MWLFIRRINESTTQNDLNQFVSTGLKQGLLSSLLPKRGTIKRCEILCITDTRTQAEERHGLVQVESVKSANALLERLNGKELNGKQVEVHKYYRRSSYRDRRLNPARPPGDERRRQDRRRQSIHIEVLHAPRAQGLDGASRAYN